MKYRTATPVVALALALFLCGAPGRARADLVYTLNVDTSSISGTQGYLDLQFNPTGGDAALTATVTTLTGDATVGSFTTSGDVTGTGVPLVFSAEGAGGPFNDAFAPTKFASSLGLIVDITTPDNISTASFQVTLYDSSNPPNPLLSTDPNNPYDPSVIELNLQSNPGGTVPTVTTVVNGAVATATPVGQSVPEPGVLMLSAQALGCLVVLAIARRKYAARAAWTPGD